MKKSLILFVLICCISIAKAQTDPGAEIAARIADRMKDSLQLSNIQRDSVYTINLQLHTQKMTARQQHTEPEALRQAIQQVENIRDSLYRPVLGEEKYLLYKQKKINLISNQ